MRADDKVVGVIGGMGPGATVEFLRRLVAATPARDDSEHLRILVDNNPKVPSRIAALVEGDGPDPAPVLCGMARGLEAQGADFLVIPCNTAHYYLPAITRSVTIPLLDMVALSIEKLGTLASKTRRIALLASPAVRRVGLYESRLREAGFEALFPGAKDEARLFEVIRAVKAQNLGDEHRRDYLEIARGLIDADADAFLIACTELSMIGPPANISCPNVDALDVLVDATIAHARPDVP